MADETAEAGRALAGIDYMRAIRDGAMPKASIQDTLGFDLVEVDDGAVAFTCEPGPHVLNPMGVVHGGLAMTLLDSACGAAVHTTLPPGRFYGTLETKVNLVRTITGREGVLRAEGRVVHRGSTVATSEGRLVDGTGKLYAHATSTCLILGG